MEPEKRDSRHGKRRSHVADQEEAKVWRAFYHKASSPSIAAELIAHLEQDKELLAQHQGLYLQCRHSVRQARRRKAIAAAVGHLLAALARSVIACPCCWVAGACSFSLDVARACAGQPVDSDPASVSKRGVRRAKVTQAETGAEPKVPESGAR